jgi:hypothetical protein
MAKLKDIIGHKFGRLTVVKEVARRGKNNYYRFFLCHCDCGKDKEIYMGSLTRKLATSCGCFHKDRIIETKTKHGFGGRNKRSAEYKVWTNIKSRCNNPKVECYPRYGGRGVYVCERWMDKENGFANFLADMGERPSPKHSIERKKGALGYEPDNCVWATTKEQTRNICTNRWLEHNGVRMIITDWATHFKVTYSSINQRLKRGDTFKQVYDYYTKKNSL